MRQRPLAGDTMAENTRTIIGADDLRVLRKVLRWLFALLSVLTLATALAITAIEFDLNRDGVYCDDAGLGLVYLEGLGCSVNFLSVSEIFLKSVFVYFVLYLMIISVFLSVGFALYLVRGRGYLNEGNRS